MEFSKKELETDVLVIGTGIAGCFAAIRAKELGANVVMVEQGKSGFWGQSNGGMHRLRVVLPDDDFDTVMGGTVKECEYMIDQEYAAEALKETWTTFQDLLKLGIEFRRDDSGNIQWYFCDTLYPNFKQRQVLFEPMGTYKHILKVNKEAIRRGVKVLDRVLITDLLSTDGKVQGAVGFHTRDGNFYLIKAKAVVMASGGFGGGGVSYPSLTGDGIAMGVKAGAELRGMEFGRTEVGGLLFDRGYPSWVYMLTNPQEEEVTITNVKGEEFLEKYELGRRLPGRKYYGPPWRLQLMAMLKELREGRGPCYVDYRAPQKADRLREFWGSYFERALKQIALTGTTLDEIKYELGVTRGHNQGGGIRIDAHGQSSLPGLYSGGVASDLCGTVQYTYLSGLNGAMITGRRAGDSAAKYALSQSQPIVNEKQVERFQEHVYEPLNRRQGVTSDEMRLEITKNWLNVDIRNEIRLRKAHENFQNLRKTSSQLVAKDLQELAKCHKIENYLECSDAIAVAAYARRESRLEHIREDYPLTDNKEWLKWVIVRLDGDELRAYLEEIPINRWKYKPEPHVVNRLRLKEEV